MFHTAFIICRKNALAYLKNIRSILKHLDSSSFISQRNPTTYDRPPLPCTYPFARNWAWRKCWRVRDIPCTIKAPWLLSSKQLTLSQSPYFLPFFFFLSKKILTSSIILSSPLLKLMSSSAFFIKTVPWKEEKFVCFQLYVPSMTSSCVYWL